MYGHHWGHETGGSETEDFITHSNSSSQNTSFFGASPLHPNSDEVTPTQQWVVLQESKPELNEPKSFITGSMPVWTLPRRRCYPYYIDSSVTDLCSGGYLPRLLTTQIILKKDDLEQELSVQKHKTHGKLSPNIRIKAKFLTMVYKALYNWSLSLQFLFFFF